MLSAYYQHTNMVKFFLHELECNPNVSHTIWLRHRSIKKR